MGIYPRCTFPGHFSQRQITYTLCTFLSPLADKMFLESVIEKRTAIEILLCVLNTPTPLNPPTPHPPRVCIISAKSAVHEKMKKCSGEGLAGLLPSGCPRNAQLLCTSHL